jgi:hypothetical protein
LEANTLPRSSSEKLKMKWSPEFFLFSLIGIEFDIFEHTRTAAGREGPARISKFITRPSDFGGRQFSPHCEVERLRFPKRSGPPFSGGPRLTQETDSQYFSNREAYEAEQNIGWVSL